MSGIVRNYSEKIGNYINARSKDPYSDTKYLKERASSTSDWSTSLLGYSLVATSNCVKSICNADK